MHRGPVIIVVFLILGILGGLGGWWWNYWISHRAMEFWGTENARLVRLAPKVEYFNLETSINDLSSPSTSQEINTTIQTFRGPKKATKYVDLSQARGLIHLRNAILSDDQYDWKGPTFKTNSLHNTLVHVLRFSDYDGRFVDLLFDIRSREASLCNVYKPVDLGPLAESLEKFLALELPRAEAAARQSMETNRPAAAKSE